MGEKKIKEGTKSSKWWTTEVQIEIKEKKKAWMKYKRTKDPRDMEDYKIKRNKCKKIAKEAKKKTWQEFGENLEEKFNQDNKDFWKIIRYTRGKYGRKVRSIKDKENNLKVETEEVLEVWREHFKVKI